MKDWRFGIVPRIGGCLLLLSLQAAGSGIAAAEATPQDPSTADEEDAEAAPEPPVRPADNGRRPGRGMPLAPESLQAQVAPPGGTEAIRAAPAEASRPQRPATADGSTVFVDRAAEVGLAFTHENGRDGRYLFAEVVGSGAALFDYDGDGDLDAFLVQGGRFAEGGGVAEAAAAGTAKGRREGALDRKGPEPATASPEEPPVAPDGKRPGTGEPPTPPPASESSAAATDDAPAGPSGGAAPADHRLFRNLLAESGELAFEDVTEASGIRGGGYGMGVAVGDVDADGDLDLYVTALGGNRLWRNRGDGSFEDATVAARADDPRWSTAASFFDADLDGDLDLWVGNYTDWSVDRDETCHATAGHRDYCGPLSYPPVADRLLENRGDGTFLDASSRTGVRFSTGAALGSLAHDFVGDPRPELYVANDASANQLWQAAPATAGAEGGGGAPPFAATLVTPWRNVALAAGAALNGHGRPEGSMGVDAGDYDGDGDLDLFLAHVHRETNTLYENDGAGHFTDATSRAGLAVPSRGRTGFGTGFLDYDNDGWLDLLVVNGTVNVLPGLAAAGDPYPLHQPDQLFRNLGRAGDGEAGTEAGGAARPPVRFADVSASAGEALAVSRVSRGAAFGDVDGDGDIDVLINDSGAPARLLVNQVGQRAHWLGLHLLRAAAAAGDGGAATVRVDDPTARVTLETGSGRRLLRRVRVDGSYLAAHDPRVLFGLGEETAVTAAHVRWGDGTEETFPLAGEPVDRYLTLVRGTGRAPAATAEARPDAAEAPAM